MPENNEVINNDELLQREQELKEKKVVRKKRSFSFVMVLIGTAALISVITFGAFYIYKKYLAPRVPIVIQPKIDEPLPPTIEEPPVKETVVFKSDSLKLSLVYEKSAKLFETSDFATQKKKIEIYFSNDTDIKESSESVDANSISNGYIFKISTFVPSVRNLDEIVRVKKESVVAACPNTALFSETYAAPINGIDSRFIDVRNCNGDFTISYTPKFGMIYAIEQVYKGDLGYKQLNKAKTQEIMDSIRFYPEPTAEPEPFQTYTNDAYKFSFEHPYFDVDCCNLEGPPSTTRTDKLLTLADKETFINEDNFDGFAIYGYKIGWGGENSYEAFLEKQKKTLVDDYVVVKGAEPTLQEITTQIDGKEAVLLRGYTWRENDLIYCKIAEDKVLIISVKNMTGDNFESKLDKIFSSFKFF